MINTITPAWSDNPNDYVSIIDIFIQDALEYNKRGDNDGE